MRIISGLYRGKKLKAPLDALTRPTSDRVKENLFNILSNRMSLQNIRVLDLFSGSGALGIEALSRGAEIVTFVENHPNALKILKKNTKSFQKQCTIVDQNVLTFLGRAALEPYDLILMDPPYHDDAIDLILKKIKEYQWIKEKALIAIETANDKKVSSQHFAIKDQRTYGQTALWLLEKS
jgi:16S rRNA (guanine966-N2)-methyltransferase